MSGSTGGATAESMLVANVPLLGGDETVKQAVEGLYGNGYDSAETLFVVSPARELLGTLSLADLLRRPAEAQVKDVMRRPPAGVSRDTSAEEVVMQAIDSGVATVPVVDATGHLLGAVPPAAVFSELRGRSNGAIAELERARREDLQAHHALLATPRHRAAARLPWLLCGLLGSLVTTALMSRFERTLAANIAIAFFVPGLGYLIDAVGTQTEAVVVRGLALGQVQFRRVFWGELRTGLLLGTTLGALVVGPIWWAFGNPGLAAAVALTMLTGATLASVIALSLPWVIARAGRDPAFGSGPIATIITYVVTLLVYFTAVRLLA